jgi:excisionase family DNA binding protein
MTAATGSCTGPRRRANGGAPSDTAAGRSGRGRDDAARAGSDEWLTVDEVCKELKIGRRTFERWRMLGKAPRAVPLAGNGPLRIRRRWLEEWMETGS